MIDQKNVIIGTIIAVILLFILGKLLTGPAYTGIIGSFIALIVAGIVVGYLVNNSVKIGAMNGALAGLLTGVIYIILIYLMSGFSKEVVAFLIIASMWYIPLFILLGVGGGIMGSVIKIYQQGKKSPEDEVPVESPKKDEEK
ncbi:DUF5518 domain-containing protein [Methanobacterium petrolearium]|uniref:DUF5518 domain-containing protein n=1 Tax=Methanobacterium petrolearium TaxID=710190 RepID=UPI001AE3E7CB|nr:DUF5518 domain-containing protein [Methanobacterium petrolearium]MBP1944941.1 hypothetical protein [Methanobacterium petrolearium]BDZ70259.1 hypothetical protein GCM10025861_07760 [Methanobacterium petrolearium]